ncbi:MAG: DHH family phosphoesterase [Desulfamplus sp.]|nr:DHH family phosphoesterase [Desulfamplus sp.]
MSHIQRLEKFTALFSSDNRVLVVINADPDAIASAMAIKRLLWRKVSEVKITYFNEIRRPDNLTMLRVLNIKIIPIKEIDEKHFDKFVVVDSQPDHHECFAMFRYDAIIDHHPVSCDCALFNDIRPEYGACSTMMTEYIKAADIKPSKPLATALLMGIKTDTASFLRQTALEDVRAFQFLYKYANPSLIARIEHAEFRDKDVDFIAKAIRRKKIINHRVYAHTGKIENPDQCVITADFFMKIDSANWSIVSGIYNKKLIIIIRNDGLRKSAGNTVKQAFDYIGSAGGHRTMARVEIKLEDLEKEFETTKLERASHNHEKPDISEKKERSRKEPLKSPTSLSAANRNSDFDSDVPVPCTLSVPPAPPVASSGSHVPDDSFISEWIIGKIEIHAGTKTE